MSPPIATRTLLVLGLCVALAGVVGIGSVAGVGSVAAGPSGADGGSEATGISGVDTSQSVAAQDGVSEEAVVEPAPEEGDPYFEAAAGDGSWISYINPRDEYRTPYLGEGSGKMCVTLVNENGEPVTGESVPGTTVTVPTGDELEWHGDADPFTVQYPLTDTYDRPLDSDQFGTTDDLPQGDGYLDSHCLEWHGLTENDTVTYGEARIDGEHADDVELVGYVQQTHEAWDTNVDPIDDAESYEATGGGWTYHPDGSHGQVVVVLQLDGDPIESGATDAGSDADGTSSGGEETESTQRTDETNPTDNATTNPTDDSEPLPGFGILVAVGALSVVLVERARRIGG